jgi:hypothetical protein
MLTAHGLRKAAERSVDRIWSDMTDRSGLSFDDIDADTKREMRETWINIAESAIKETQEED